MQIEKYLNKIHCCDCLEFMKKLPDKSVDIILTDPPYGINMSKGFGGFGGFGKPIARRHYKDTWDKNIPNKKVFDEIFRISKNQIIFGGNYFTKFLPQSNHWLVWDKLQTMPSFSDCELIYTSFLKNSVKKYIFRFNGLLSDSKDIRQHPTQKPSELISLILRDYSNKNDIIFDPFLGSGTTAVACERLGRRWLGCEISQEYCDIANARIEAERRQLKLPI